MEDTLVTLIHKYKSGDKNAFLKIQNKMNPLLVKYAMKLCFEDFEDMYSELTLALLECINQLQYYDNEYQILNFIKKAISNKFHNLYRISQKYSINTQSVEIEKMDIQSHTIESTDNFSNVIWETTLIAFIANLPDNKKKFAHSILIEELTDSEIAKKYHVTRQYIHRLRKNFYKELSDKIIL